MFDTGGVALPVPLMKAFQVLQERSQQLLSSCRTVDQPAGDKDIMPETGGIKALSI